MRASRLLLGPLGFALAAGAAAAEILTDGTAGPRLELAGPEFAIGAALGTRAGDNLFHSFERFSLAAGERATFTGPEAIRNVISRVTGGARSDIDGAIRSEIAGADFYLINPAGVLFGPNASLDVTGSFHVSTADELRFADGEAFSARAPEASSFSVAAPEAFGFLHAAPHGAIRVAGSQLGLAEAGQALSLSAGRLVVENGSVLGANRVALAAQASAGTVPLAGARPAQARSGTIELGSETAGAPAGVTSFGPLGGNLRIEAGVLRIANAVVGDVRLAGGADASTGSVDVAAQRVIIRNEALAPGASNGILTFSGGTGPASDVRVAAAELTVVGGVISSTPTLADGGRIVIETDRMLLVGGASTPGAVAALTGAFGPGTSGGVTIAVRDVLTIGAGGQINTASLGDGPAGSVHINLDGDAALVMQPGSLIEATARGSGAGGDIVITGGEVTINGGIVSAETFAGGSGGTIAMDTGGLILNNGFVGANSREDASNDAGPVMVEADRIEIRNEGRIFNGTNGGGNGGDVTVTAGTLLIDGALDHAARFNTGISAAAQQGSGGRSGRVTVQATDAILLWNQGEIASGTGGAGPAGDVLVGARAITLRDGGRIDSASTGGGNAGSLTIVAHDRLTIDRGVISTSARTAGGGRITIAVGELIDLRKSAIESSVAEAAGNAGDITIDPDFLILDDSQILARAVAGRGGDIRIVAGDLVISPDSLINAEAGAAGVDGTVVTSTPATDLISGLVVLDVALLDADALLGERCAAREDVGASSLTGAGRGGLPPSPDQPLGSAYAPPPRADAAAPAPLAALPLLAMACSGRLSD